MSAPVKIAVAGLGRIGRIHLENLVTKTAGAEVIAISDPFPESHAFAQQLGVTQIEPSFEALLAAQPDAVYVCTPTDTHADYVIAAAKAGVHVFCEKPIDLSIERVCEVLTAVESAGVKLMVGFNRRFDPNFAKIQSMVTEGKVGTPHMIRITSRDPGPPPIEYIKVSGGMFLDMSIHDFDIARFLAGSEVTEVYAKGSNLVDPAIGEADDIDTATMILTFANGATAVIDNSRQAVYGYDQRIEVFGSKGMVSAANETPDTHTYFNRDGVQSSLPQHFFLERYAEAYAIETKVFVDAIAADTEPPVSGQDALAATVIAHAANRSKQDNCPISL